MTQQSMTSSRPADLESWREGAADICTHLGLALIGLGLLYWGLLLAYACSLASGWVAAFFDRKDPLASLGDPFMWMIWLVYWTVAFGMLRRGLGDRKRR